MYSVFGFLIDMILSQTSRCFHGAVVVVVVVVVAFFQYHKPLKSDVVEQKKQSIHFLKTIRVLNE